MGLVLVVAKLLTDTWIIGLLWSQLVPQIGIGRVGVIATTY